MASLRNAVIVHLGTAVVLSLLLVGAAIAWDALAAQQRATQATAERVATLLERRIGLERSLSLRALAPAGDTAWLESLQSASRPGQCVEWRRVPSDGRQRVCHGGDPDAPVVPRWFRALWPAAEPLERPVVLRGATVAWVRVEPDAAQAAALAWSGGVPLLGLCAGTLVIAWLLLSLLVRRALAPLQALGAGLDRLAQGSGPAALGLSGIEEIDPLLARFNTLSDTLARRTEERDTLLRRLAEVQEAERGHVARELHDQLGQHLAAVQALAASIEASAPAQPPSIAREAARIQQLIAPMMGNLRSLLVQLRPPGLAEFGLVRVLAHLVEGWDRTATGTRFRLEADDEAGALPDDTVAVHLFRAAQECLTNAVKHARARDVVVRLGRAVRAARAGLELVVEDDGDGDGAAPAADRRPGLGMLGLRERMALLGGRLEIERAAPRGHRVRVWVPLASGSARDAAHPERPMVGLDAVPGAAR